MTLFICSSWGGSQMVYLKEVHTVAVQITPYPNKVIVSPKSIADTDNSSLSKSYEENIYRLDVIFSTRGMWYVSSKT